MTAKKPEPVADIEYSTVFSHPDFDPYVNAPAIGVPNFQVDKAAEVLEVPTERAKSATTKEK